jgi:hypothetical protein
MRHRQSSICGTVGGAFLVLTVSPLSPPQKGAYGHFLGRICDPLMRQWYLFVLFFSFFGTTMVHSLGLFVYVLYAFCITCSKVTILRDNMYLHFNLFGLALLFFIYMVQITNDAWLFKFVFSLHG